MLGLHIKRADGDAGVILGESIDKKDWLIDREDGGPLLWWCKGQCAVAAQTVQPAETDSVYGTVVFRTRSAVARAKERFGRVIIVIHKVIDGVEELPSEYLNGGNYLYF